MDVSLNKQGEVIRFTAEATKEYHEEIQVACSGTARKSRTGIFTLPADPTLLRRMAQRCPEYTMSARLKRHLSEMAKRQQQVYHATNLTEPVSSGKLLYPFQNASVRVLEAGGSFIIRHSMGLGKTPIACRAIEYMGLQRSIVLAPASVKWSWVKHLQEWSDVDNIVVLDTGSEKTDMENVRIFSRKREEKLKDLLESGENFCIVSGYELMQTLVDLMLRYDYDALIIDEAHRLKNRNAKRTKELHRLAKVCARRWLFTGTLIRNCYTDVFAPLAFVDPIRFSSYWNFVNIYLETTPNHFGGVDIIGLKDKDEFNAMLSVYTYMLTKEDVMQELPQKVYTTYPLDMKKEQAKIYKQMEKEFIAELDSGLDVVAPTTIAKLIRLRQICLSPALLHDESGRRGPHESAKIEVLEELIEQLSNEERRFIIFTYFRGFIPFVEEILRDRKIKYDVIVGGQKSKERMKIQEDLTSGKIDAIIGTAQSMGEGMNLQAADTAIFCDLDWVPANNIQAEDRIHRGDIKDCPHIIKLTHLNTVEQDILDTISRKERIQDDVSGHTETIKRMMTRLKGGK